MMIAGLPKYRHSVNELLPPWWMTASTWGMTEGCGNQESTMTLPGRSVYWSL